MALAGTSDRLQLLQTSFYGLDGPYIRRVAATVQKSVFSESTLPAKIVDHWWMHHLVPHFYQHPR